MVFCPVLYMVGKKQKAERVQQARWTVRPKKCHHSGGSWKKSI